MVRFIFENINLQLRSPEFGNTDSLEFTKISRRTRGGDLVTYREVSWPTAEILRMTFLLLKNERESLLRLIDRSLGKNVTFYDHEGYQWLGVITAPEAPISQDSRYHDTVNIEFQGVKI